MSSPTRRLYYEDSRIFDFEASAVSVADAPDKPGFIAVVLDRTCFYPEGGGQVADAGTIGGIAVAGVLESPDGSVVHLLPSDPQTPLRAGAPVSCSVDGRSRLQNMRDHTGQHILSESFIRTGGCHTVSMHMGAEYMTIDLAVPAAAGVKNFRLSKEAVDAAEDMANETVRADLEVSTRVVDRTGLSEFSFRKMPDLPDGSFRVVRVGDFDTSLCCGTHVARTGEIGLIKVVGQEKVPSGVRVKFLTGARALADYRIRAETTDDIAASMSIRPADIKAAVERLEAENRALSKSRGDYFDRYHAMAAARLAAGEGVTRGFFFDEPADLSWQDVTRAGQIYSKACGAFAFVLIRREDAPGSKAFRFVAGRSAGHAADMKAFFAAASSAFKVKGGGSVQVVQGGLVDVSRLDEFKAFAAERLSV